MDNFKCPVCGNEVHKTDEFAEVTSELGFGIFILNSSSKLGFGIKAQTFQCEKDGKKFIICPDCAGKMSIENTNGFYDCPACQGTGIIEIVKIAKNN